MKILLVSDLHYALKQFDWIAATAADFDLVVVAGDYIDIAGQLEGHVQVVVILKYLKRLAAQTRVIVSSGNHDLDVRNADGEKTAAWMQRVRQLGIPTDGDTIEIENTLITICQWWDGPVGRDQVAAQLARDAERRKGRWLWVYHAPPAGSPTCWNGRKHFGDEELTRWIGEYKPDVVFTGHIHEAPFKADGSWADRIGDTWVFNSGRQIGPTPTYVALDTEAQEAAWFSIAGAELAQLNAPLVRPLPELGELPAWLAASNRDRGPSPA